MGHFDYQPTLPTLLDPKAGRRREPRQRKGESWKSYAVRQNTWRRNTYGDPPTPEQRQRQVERNMAWRERIMRSTEVNAYRLREREKAKPAPTWAVFFWWDGNPIHHGSCSGYLNAASLPFLPAVPPYDRRPRGKHRVNFSSCF